MTDIKFIQIHPSSGAFKRPKDFMKTKDLMAIDERLLELEILDKELRPSLSDAKQAKREANQRCRELTRALADAQAQVRSVPYCNVDMGTVCSTLIVRFHFCVCLQFSLYCTVLYCMIVNHVI